MKNKTLQVYRHQPAGKKSASLHPEDRMLWETVIRHIRPLSSRPGMETLSGSASLAKTASVKKDRDVLSAGKISPSAKMAGSYALNIFDSAVHNKIARGNLHIEARVDLHGLTQEQAYSLLLRFLQSARHRELRHILIITGKGGASGNGGILQQAVPRWLATASFRLYVNAFESASRQHGGAGALYVRLRR